MRQQKCVNEWSKQLTAVCRSFHCYGRRNDPVLPRHWPESWTCASPPYL